MSHQISTSTSFISGLLKSLPFTIQHQPKAPLLFWNMRCLCVDSNPAINHIPQALETTSPVCWASTVLCNEFHHSRFLSSWNQLMLFFFSLKQPTRQRFPSSSQNLRSFQAGTRSNICLLSWISNSNFTTWDGEALWYCRGCLRLIPIQNDHTCHNLKMWH